MNNETCIELYKKRSIGERFSATSDFISQNGKVLFKNLLYIGIPLALLQGFLMQNYTVEIMRMTASYLNPAESMFTPSYLGLMFVSICFSLFVYVVTGAILKKYQEGTLNKDTAWSDLKQDVFPFAGKLFLQGLICMLGFMIVSGILVAFVIGILFTNGVTGLVPLITMFIIFALMIIILPPFILIPFPIFFENASAWQGVKKGLKLGFKNWASTFLTFLLGVLIYSIVYYIVSMPYIIHFMLTNGAGGFTGYFLAIISAISLLFLTPISLVFFGFQYTSLVEKTNLE